MAGRGFARKLLTTACALSHSTELAAAHLGAAYFLPALFVDRFTHLGGIERAVFAAQLAGCRSFEDERWAAHWQAIAASHIEIADAALSRLAGPTVAQLLDPRHPAGAETLSELGALLAPAATILSERGAIAPIDAVEAFRRTSNGVGDDAAIALDGLIKVIVYTFAAAWPGYTPHRMRAYQTSQRLCEVLTSALAPAMGVQVQHLDIDVGGGDVVHGTTVFPPDAESTPTVLITNGLEGTVAEMLLPVLSYRTRGLGLFVMEMPGTYAYRRPLAAEGQGVYRSVIDNLSADPRVDANRIGMLGLSFGGYWVARTASVDPRLRVAVVNGAPAHHTFGLGGTLGVPEIMVWTLAKATQAHGNLDLMRKLRALSLKSHYSRITAPLFVINGDADTLVATQDSIDIATHAPNAVLKLYPGDDHCAMGNAPDWFEKSVQFLADHLLT